MTGLDNRLSDEAHMQMLREKVIPESALDLRAAHDSPKFIMLAGQPGAGKRGLALSVTNELKRDVVVIDPDALRDAHPDVERLRQQYPYTWAAHTHEDASQWAKELRAAAVEGRRNIILDTTMGNGDSAVTLIKDLQAKGYQVEIRGVIAHELESELGVDRRFTKELDAEGYGRYVPEEIRTQVYEALPRNLDKVHAETGISIRLYGREGAQVYDSHSDAGLPGAALEQERQERLKNPHNTLALRDGWRAQADWHANLQEKLRNNPHLSPETEKRVEGEHAATRVVGPVGPRVLYTADIDHTVRVRPNMVRGAVIGGTAATAFEATTEGAKVADLYARDNRTGAEAKLLDFGARSVGGWTGAAVGAKVGTLVGIESGPGAVVTGIIGAGLGAWGASEVVEWIEEYRINNQTDSAGRVWTFDPEQPGRGWTHSEREIVGTVGTVADRPIYGATRQVTADAALTQELNYKASSMAVELRLSAPDQPINPYSIAGDATDTPSVLPRSWERNPDSGEWRREVVHEVYEHGIKSTTVEAAEPAKAAQLDEMAQSIIGFNAARSPAAFAKQYEQAYAEHGWSRYGPTPDSVVWAARHPDLLLASDGRTYQRNDQAQWQHDGWIYDSLAAGNVRDELAETYSQIQAIQREAAPLPESPEHRIHAFSAQERDAYEQAAREANRLGISKPEAQQIGASTVAETRGERLEERLTPQTVIDAHANNDTLRAPDVATDTVQAHEQRPIGTAPPKGYQPADSVQAAVPADRQSQSPIPIAGATSQPAKADDQVEREARAADLNLTSRARSVPRHIPAIDTIEHSDRPSHVEHSPASLDERLDSALPQPAADDAHGHDALATQHSADRRLHTARADAPEATQQPVPHTLSARSDTAPAGQGEGKVTPNAEAIVSERERLHALHPQLAATGAAIPHPEQGSAHASPDASCLPRPTPTQPDHSDHPLYQQVRSGVAALDAAHGRSFDAVSERMTASLLVLAKENDLVRVDHVLLSHATTSAPAGHTTFVVQGEPCDPAHLRASMPTAQAAQTPVDESMQRLEMVSREHDQRAQAQQLEQQMHDVRGQQENNARTLSMG